MPWKRSTRSEIVHIVVTGYQKIKEPSKHYVFVIDITWNNSERFEIYRRYSDFFSFQTTLKALFPGAAGRKNDMRVIPQLPKRIFVGRSHVAKVAEARLEQINRYCQTLISLEPLISESVHVVGFFSPRSTDKPLPKLHLHRPTSIHPQKVPAGSLFEDYCALAEYQAEDDSQISFKAGDKVLVLSKDDSGWWMCSVDGGKVGWAPPSYLKKCEKAGGESDSDDDFVGLPESYAKEKDSDDSGVDHDAETTPESSLVKGFKTPQIDAEEYKAIDSYEAEGPGQIGFEAGSIVHVLDKMEDGWWFVSNGTDEGWAPCSYLENTNGGDEEEVAVSTLGTKRHIQKYISLEEYKAEEDDELSFPKGVIVDVFQKRLDGWWLIKLHSKVGLAPATFLKKLTGPVTGEAGEEPLFRKVNVASSPPQPEFKIINKQPPRKQSVRYRASLKKNAKSKLDAEKSAVKPSPLHNAQTQSLSPPHSEPASGNSPKLPGKERPNPPTRQRITTPISSDSESETQEKAKAKPLKSPRMIKRGLESRIKKFERRRDSESSSMSEDSTSPTSRKKLEPLTKKSSSPDLRPAPLIKLKDKSISVDEALEDRRRGEGPVPPPRPYKPDSTRPQPAIPRITEDLLSDTSSSTGPNRPARPRVSEIRRAKERTRNASPSFPRIYEGDRDTDASSVFSVSSKSSSDVSPRVPPPKQKIRKKISAVDSPSPSLLPPPVPRRKSVGDSNDPQAPPLSAPPERPSTANNPLSQQMADTLIKYILASDDPTLRLALREIVTSDPQAMQVIHSDSAPRGEGPPPPPQRPY